MLKDILLLLATFYLPAVVMWRVAYFSKHARFIKISSYSFYLYTLSIILYFVPFLADCTSNMIDGFKHCSHLSNETANIIGLTSLALWGVVIISYVLVLMFYGTKLIYKKVSQRS